MRTFFKERSRTMRYMFMLFMLALAFSFAGCSTPDYTGMAVDKARKYALEHLKGLDENQRHFIRFTQPELYSDLIFERQVMPLSDMDHVKFVKPSHFPIDPDQDLMHHCFVWAPPGLDAKVVVVGDGERNLRFWSPFRVILKNFIPADVDYNAAKSAAVSFAATTLPEITQSEINRIRFSEPDVFYTKLLVQMQFTAESENQTPLEAYLADEKEKAKGEIILTQLSLVWKADNADSLIVVTGFSRFGCLNKWQPHTVQYLPVDTLKQNTLNEKEIAAIEKTFSADPARLVHPPERKAERGNAGKETGSIFGGDLAF